MLYWVGLRTWNWEVAGSIPGSPAVISEWFRGHFFVDFVMSWDVSRSGFGDVFGWI